MKQGTLKTNTFYHYANKYINCIEDTLEIERINMTDIFWKEMDKIIESGELINMNINAPPTSGKSITGMAIAQKIMKKHFKKNFGIEDIDRDQQEFSKTMRNPKIRNTIRVIDEWNDLEKTGENSSVETALFNYFSDVMAQRYVHKISCSPSNTTDKNALILLEVISSDKHNKINYCKLYYKIFSAGTEINQLLGYVEINVNQILNQSWYKEYRKRKFEKMNLILEEGIFQPRKLEYAKIAIEVINKLRNLAKMTKVLNKSIIRNYVKMAYRNAKMPQSIIGEELATRDIEGILDLYKSHSTLSKKIIACDEQYKQGKITQTTHEIIKSQLQEARNEIQIGITIQNKDLQKHIEINQKYNKILE